MDRLIAYRANEPERLRASLLSERPVLFPDLSDEVLAEASGTDERPAEMPAKLRWGIGYYIGGEPHIQRFSATLAEGYAALKSLRTGVVIAQVGAPGTTSVPPYRYGRYLLGLHGTVPKLDVQQSELTQALPAFLHYNLRDHSAGERLLHLVCGRLHEAAPEYLQDPGLSPEVAVAALAAVLHAVVGPGAGPQPAERTLTMTMTNGDWLAVAQQGGPAIWYHALAGLKEARAAFPGDGQGALPEPAEPHSDSYRGIWALGRPNIDAQATATHGFKQIPADHTLVVASDLTFQILPLG